VWLLAGLLVFTCVACGQPAMTTQDARTFARKAVEHMGFTSVVVTPKVTLAAYHSPDPKFRNQKAVQVWQVHTTVPEGIVDIYVPRKGSSAVFVRDEATGGGPLLTDRQFRLLRDFRLNPAADRRRNHLRGPTIAAVVLAVIVACALFVAVILGRPNLRRPKPESENETPAQENREPASVL
jgi:hypothetical protein